MQSVLTPTLIVDIGARAAHAARAGEATFSVPELADVARTIAVDDRVDELRGEASRWLADGARYHDLVRLGARYVREIDRVCPPTAAVYVPKASGELEPMLALWPHVLALPTATPLAERELIELRAYPVHVLG